MKKKMKKKKSESLKRPYVICHMVPSVDGRIDVTHWNLPPKERAEYDVVASTFGADAWMIGRISMEPYAGKARIPKRKVGAPIPRTDFVARSDAPSYAIALDPSGKLRWEKSSIDEEHVVTVLTESVSDAYLAFLRDKRVSYVFGGKKRIDLAKVLQKLRRAFGIEKVLLEGGGRINGTFLEADLVDEISILVAPVADGSLGTPTLFDGDGKRGPARRLALVAMERRAGDLVWLRYRVRHA